MRTALYEHHRALGAKIVDFCGWEMPVQYQGIISEHLAVRQQVGLFDVSHMGRILVQGPDAERFLDFISTNTIAGKTDGSATYTVWSYVEGGCVDDTIVYRQNSDNFFVIVNAGNRQKDLEYLKQQSAGFNVNIQERYDEEGILAVQGPHAIALITQIFPDVECLKNMHFSVMQYNGQEVIVSKTGYTGSGGVEIYASNQVIIELWSLLLHLGQQYGIKPIGLGARDTLRLEMGYALYGHEISDKISANESVSAWTIKWNKQNFVGKEAMLQLEKNAAKRSEYGIILLEPGIARADYEVWKNGSKIGIVTSGTQSPVLQKAIAIILVEGTLQLGEFVEVQIRQHYCKAEVVKLPFVGV